MRRGAWEVIVCAGDFNQILEVVVTARLQRGVGRRGLDKR